MAVKEVGIETEARELHPENVQVPMAVTEVGMTILFRE